MIPVTIPTTDVNSESALILRWYVEDRVEVRAGEALVEIETSKAILDVEAPDEGVLLRAGAEGDKLRLDQPLGYLFDSLESLERYEREQAQRRAEHPGGDAERITAPARRRAAELAVDLDELARAGDGLITAKLVEEAAAARGAPDRDRRPDPLPAPVGLRRLLIIGAGLGATQVLDILGHDAQQQAVGVVDDEASRHGELIEGVPVVGGVERALELFAEGAVDAAVISISTSVAARARLRERCRQAGLPLVNVVDPTARFAAGVRIGTGNVVCAFCHFGTGAVVGDNNFFSAYNSFDHHSELGSDISTGPGCITSGLVTIGDRCRLGTGIFIEPKVTLGSGVQVASGAVVVGSVPADHVVKTRVITTAVVPVRRP